MNTLCHNAPPMALPWGRGPWAPQGAEKEGPLCSCVCKALPHRPAALTFGCPVSPERFSLHTKGDESGDVPPPPELSVVLPPSPRPRDIPRRVPDLPILGAKGGIEASGLERKSLAYMKGSPPIGNGGPTSRTARGAPAPRVTGGSPDLRVGARGLGERWSCRDDRSCHTHARPPLPPGPSTRPPQRKGCDFHRRLNEH